MSEDCCLCIPNRDILTKKMKLKMKTRYLIVSGPHPKLLSAILIVVSISDSSFSHTLIETGDCLSTGRSAPQIRTWKSSYLVYVLEDYSYLNNIKHIFVVYKLQVSINFIFFYFYILYIYCIRILNRTPGIYRLSTHSHMITKMPEVR